MEERKNNIKKLLDKIVEYNVSSEEIKLINKKFPITKNCEYIKTEQIELGNVIYLINNTFDKIMGGCIVKKIKKTQSKIIEEILVSDMDGELVWRIKPTKYYIFKSIATRQSENEKLIHDFLKTFKK
jgi:hypothetical protein